MRTLRSFILVLALGLVLGADAAVAGYYLEKEAVFPHPQTFQPVRALIRSWYDGKRFKRESPLRDEVVIIDLERREVVGINDTKRTYWKLSAERYRQMTLMSLLVLGVSPTPDGGVVVPDPLFVPTGQTAEIAGRKASEYKVNGALPPGVSTSAWLSREVPIPISRVVDELRLALGDPKHPSYEKLFEQWSRLSGYPVQTVTTVQMPSGTVITSETLLLYREEDIPPEVFEVPKGYALTVDPITEAEQMAQKAASSPAGIGAPLPSGGAKQSSQAAKPKR